MKHAPEADETAELHAMPITGEVQERFPELIESYELVDNIPTYEDTITDIE